ncbi:MAG: peptidase domain protein [Gemmatimonadetes bacterium]|nr:peptidase domain protein [Gemmatimonadota bacterium]
MMARTFSVALLLTLAAASQSSAQARLDRTRIPTPGKSPALHVPAWTHSKLANGAELIVVEKHDLPLVALTIEFVGGTSSYEPADKTGVAAFTASMMSEGTKTRSADQLSDAQQMLGISIGAGVGQETGTIGFTALKDKLQPSLALLADMMLNSTFPDSALERLRSRAVVSLTQQRDQPNTIANNVFSMVVYGDDHPYGRVLTERSAKAVTRADVVAFASMYFRPGRAVITVTGDVNPRTVRGIVEKELAAWPAGGERPTFSYPAPPAPKSRMIYLVDKPKAAQSVFAFGGVGPPRNTPDYYALEVMNNILGVLFMSRLNADLREAKGYSYGVRSGFAFGRGPGAFRAGGGMVSAKSDSALIAFMKELKGVQGDIPFTDDEMKQGKESLMQSLPGRFASVNGLAASVSSLYAQDLGENYFRDYAKNIDAITRDDLVRVAKKYIDLDHINLVIVGDRASIEGPLKATGIAPVQIVDVEGRPVLVP